MTRPLVSASAAAHKMHGASSLSAQNHEPNRAEYGAGKPHSEQRPYSEGMQQADFIRAATLVFAAQADKRLSHLDTRILGLLLRTEGPPLKRADVAAICDCHPNSVSRSAKKLAEHGYLARETRREEGNAPTRYAIPEVTTPCNPEVTSNMGVTSLVTGEIQAPPVVVTSTIDTKSSRNPEVTTLVTCPPHTPYKNTTLISERELVLIGGVGEEREPRPSRRKPRVGATERTLPSELTPAMRTAADRAGYLNGSGEAQFDRWRDWHLAKGSLIADFDASFRTWIANAQRFDAQHNRKATNVQRSDPHAGNPGAAPRPEAFGGGQYAVGQTSRGLDFARRLRAERERAGNAADES